MSISTQRLSVDWGQASLVGSLYYAIKSPTATHVTRRTTGITAGGLSGERYYVDVAINSAWVGAQIIWDDGTDEVSESLAANLATLLDVSGGGGGGGGTGTGAFVVNITINDEDGEPLLGASVRLQAVVGYVGTSDADGLVSFSLDAGSYTLAVTLEGYAFAPVAIPITDNTDYTAELTLVILSPDETQASLTAYDEDNNAESGAIFQIALSAGPGTAGTSYPRTYVTVTSDANGLVALPLLRSAVYRIRRRVAANVWSDWTSFTTTDTTTYPIPEVLGRA